MEQEKAVRIIYHSNCADGFGAAWAAYKHFKDDAVYTPGVYNEPPPDCTGQVVYCLDFSYKRDVMFELAKQASAVAVIDHHQSAIDNLAGLDEQALNVSLHLDKNRSGAILAWKYFHGEKPFPKLLQYIEDRDLWKFELPSSRELSAYIFSHPYDFEAYTYMAEVFQYITTREDARAQGVAILRKQEKDMVELLAVVTTRQTIAGQPVPVANVPYIFASEAGNRLSKNQPFAATYYDTGTHRVFSLRSQRETGSNVAKLAEMFGGGGHVNASGFRILLEDPKDPRPLAQRLAYPMKHFPEESDDV